MADNTAIALELNIDSNATDVIDQLDQKIEELKKVIASAKDGTDEFVQATQKLADARTYYEDLTGAAQTHTEAVIAGKEAYRDFKQETRAGLGTLLSLQKGTAAYNAELQKLATHKAQFQELQ